MALPGRGQGVQAHYILVGCWPVLLGREMFVVLAEVLGKEILYQSGTMLTETPL